MKNFLNKNSLTIKGAGGGGGGGGGSPPPPPVVTQYPAVIAPPQLGNLTSITSFSYAQMIDLLSDGPIEGLVNKYGEKVYNENIFEGIYLNDIPVKETSKIEKVNIDISFLREKLKTHFNSVGETFKSGTTIVSDLIYSDYKDNNNFNYYFSINNQTSNSTISITSYHPDDSILAFFNDKSLDLDAVDLIKKTFDLSPFEVEKPFLTKIKIPKFKYTLDKSTFDKFEGGVSTDSPLQLDILNLSNYIYFTINSDTLTSFNYFELPKSFIDNPLKTNSNKSTFNKTIVSETDTTFTIEIFNVNIYIWSIYNFEVGAKNVDTILNKYFSFIYIYQNNKSLFNYNLIQSEFKNGSEIQMPFNYFQNVEIDYSIQQELIGAYKITNSYSPTSTYGAGGVQRLTSLCFSNSYCPPVNISIENETSDDVRYVKSWPVEYNTAGDPYLITNSTINYSQFDKISSSRVAQDAIPITHYIGNQNVEEVYVTLGVQQLFDLANVDMVADNTSKGINGNKYKNAGTLPDGIGTYSQLPGNYKYFTETCCSLYFLIYGDSSKCGRVIDANSDMSLVVSNLFDILNPLSSNNYYNKLKFSKWNLDKIYKDSDIVQFNYDSNKEVTFYKTSATSSQPTYASCLFKYMVYNGLDCYSVGFDIGTYATNACQLEAKLKTTTSDGSPYYCFNLNQASTILNDSSYLVFETQTNNAAGRITRTQSDFLSRLAFQLGENKAFYITSIKYLNPQEDQLLYRKTVALNLIPYVDFSQIYEYQEGPTIAGTTNKSKKINPAVLKPTINSSKYPNIIKYLSDYANLTYFKNNATLFLP